MAMLVIQIDGGCRPNPGQGSFAYVVSENGRVEKTHAEMIGPATNNTAEWRGAIAALEYALTIAELHQAIRFEMDSRLVVRQLTGRWKVHNQGLKPLVAHGRRLLQQLSGRIPVAVVWVPREQNALADAAAEQCRDD
jgi:ribonuclease HI